jgi:hypothetical protein
MTYIPKAKYDIFVSYPLEAKGWAGHFELALKKEVGDWLPASQVEFYMGEYDWHMAPSDDMLEAARSSALFVITLVPGALSSEGIRFFQREWTEFGKTASLFGTVETRFAPVLLKPIGHGALARLFPLANEKAFWRPAEFYFEDRAGVPHTLLPNSRRTLYHTRISELAFHAKKRLEEIKATLGSGGNGGNGGNGGSGGDHGHGGDAKPAVKAPFAGMKVSLGEKAEELSDEWDEIRELLLNDGVDVVSTGEYAQDNAAFQNELKKELSGVDLFVQLLSPLNEAHHRVAAEGKTDSAEVKTRAHLAFDCALDRLQSISRPFAIMQWRDPKIMRGALKYWPEELLDSAYVQAVGLQQFKRAIRAKLEELRKPPPPAPTERPLFFITADQPDLDLARELSDAVLDYADVDVMTETEQERKEHFTDAMKLASGVIFLHGKASVQFVNNWLSMYVREKVKLKRSSRHDALYKAPPRKQSNEEPRLPTRDLRTLGSEELFTLEGIQQLLKEFGGAS